MRVGFISVNAQAHNAIGNQLVEKVQFFLERGADVRVFVQSLERLHPELRPCVTQVAGAEPSGPAWEYLTRADIVIVEYSQYFGLLHFLPLLAGTKPRLLVDYHSVTPPEHWRGPGREDLEQGLVMRGLVWCADAVIAHSRFTADELVQAAAYPVERMVKLGFPLDLARLQPGQPRRDWRRRLRLSHARLALFVGRLAANKRVSVLIEAVHSLRNLDPPLHALVVGDDGDLYADEARRCRELAKQLNITDRVHFVGQLNDDDLADAYRSADVFVMPSVHEGFCLPVLEAQAYGVPVVAARAAALPETVGDAGLLFAPDDADDLATSIRSVFEESMAARLRQRGLTRAAQAERSHWREEFGQLVDRLLHQPPSLRHEELLIEPMRSSMTVSAGRDVLIPVHVSNRGTLPALADGPARTLLGAEIAGRSTTTPLPGLLLPGRSAPAAMVVTAPAQPGGYRIDLWAGRCDHEPAPAPASVALQVESKATVPSPLETVQTALAEIHRLQRLPDAYVDVTLGRFARLKRWLKRKLLGNFKTAYVDVLSRQQSHVNQQLLTAVQQLAECCETLQEEVRGLREKVATLQGLDSYTTKDKVSDPQDSRIPSWGLTLQP